MANVTDFADQHRGSVSPSLSGCTYRAAWVQDQEVFTSAAGLICESWDEDSQVKRLSVFRAGVAIAVASAVSWVSLVAIVAFLV